jgi:hypothetical protein
MLNHEAAVHGVVLRLATRLIWFRAPFRLRPRKDTTPIEVATAIYFSAVHVCFQHDVERERCSKFNALATASRDDGRPTLASGLS